MGEKYRDDDIYTMDTIMGIATRAQCCGKSLAKATVKMYPHDGGLRIEGSADPNSKYWVSIQCPSCGYDWAIWKLERHLGDRPMNTAQKHGRWTDRFRKTHCAGCGGRLYEALKEEYEL